MMMYFETLTESEFRGFVAGFYELAYNRGHSDTFSSASHSIFILVHSYFSEAFLFDLAASLTAKSKLNTLHVPTSTDLSVFF